MPWKKGQSGNPKGRPMILPTIRAQARVDSHAAYNTLVEAMRDSDKWSERIAAAVQVLRLAGVSFASDVEEMKAQVEARKLATPEQIAAALGAPDMPLN